MAAMMESLRGQSWGMLLVDGFRKIRLQVRKARGCLRKIGCQFGISMAMLQWVGDVVMVDDGGCNWQAPEAPALAPTSGSLHASTCSRLMANGGDYSTDRLWTRAVPAD